MDLESIPQNIKVSVVGREMGTSWGLYASEDTWPILILA